MDILLKYIIISILVLGISTGPLPLNNILAYDALRARSAALSALPGEIADIAARPGRASSAGQENAGDETDERICIDDCEGTLPPRAERGTVAIWDGGSATLMLPLVPEDIDREIVRFEQFYYRLAAIVTRDVENGRITEETHEYAQRILSDYVGQMEKNLGAIRAKVQAGKDVSRGDSSSVDKFIQWLKLDKERFASHNDAAGLAAIEVLLKPSEEIAHNMLPLVEFARAEPTQQETERLAQLAQEQYDMFIRVLTELRNEYKEIQREAEFFLEQLKKGPDLHKRNRELAVLIKSQIKDHILQLAGEDSARQGYLDRLKTANTAEGIQQILSDLATAYGPGLPSSAVHNISELLRRVVINTEAANSIEQKMRALEEESASCEAFTYTLESEFWPNDKDHPRARAQFLKKPNDVAGANMSVARIIRSSQYLADNTAIFDGMEDSHVKKGLGDMLGLIQRIISKLEKYSGDLSVYEKRYPGSVVVFADSPLLVPDVKALYKNYNVAAIVTSANSITSHCVFTAQGLGIPVIVVPAKALGKFKVKRLAELKDILGKEAVVEVSLMAKEGAGAGTAGARKTRVIINPTQQDRQRVEKEKEEDVIFRGYCDAEDNISSHTPSGLKLSVLCNAAEREEFEAALDKKVSGFGVWRTEAELDNEDFLLFVRDYTASGRKGPSAEGTKAINKAMIIDRIRDTVMDRIRLTMRLSDYAQGSPPVLNIRTWDISDDKTAKLLSLLPAQQALKGYDFYKTPVGRVLLELLFEGIVEAVYTMHVTGEMNAQNKITLNIMFPMVKGLDDLRRILEKRFDGKPGVFEYARKRAWVRIAAKEGLDAKARHTKHKTFETICKDISYGTMCETLGFLDNREQIIEYDSIVFISVGNNDLTDAILEKILGAKATRGMVEYAHLYQLMQPVFLYELYKLARSVSEWNRLHPARQKRLGFCGGLAENPKFILYVLWLMEHFDIPCYISVPPASAKLLRNFIRHVDTWDLDIFNRLSFVRNEKLSEGEDFFIEPAAEKLANQITDTIRLSQEYKIFSYFWRKNRQGAIPPAQSVLGSTSRALALSVASSA